MGYTPAELTGVNRKLTDEEQHYICQLYATFYTPMQILRAVKTKFGKDVKLPNIMLYAQRAKWKPLIERLRQEWALGVMEIPVAHKRGRLEQLVKLLERAEKNDKVTEFRKIRQCVEILREIREEMDSGKAQFTNVYLTTIHQYSDEELLRRRAEVVERLKALGGATHVLRRSGQETNGDGQGEAVTLDAELGGGGLHQRPLGEGDGEGAPVPEGQPQPEAS